ncbi:hypothetical protein MNBD_GAMMA10-2147 [hydrothermal vent metagenome]|uniref:Prevent host death protein, Phd antitoxin n=1 Tax=hydrothermal vent metagenome TaxID=652676 RepID=A0A3B0Y1X9_9ZZZZ
MTNIAANDLKIKGVSVLEKALEGGGEAIITVRGEQKYVVINMKQYDRLREYELEIALLEARADIAEGRARRESVDEHMKRVTV